MAKKEPRTKRKETNQAEPAPEKKQEFDGAEAAETFAGGLARSFMPDIVPTQDLRVYFASQSCYAQEGNNIASAWPEFIWTSSWHKLYVGHVPETPEFAKIFWPKDIEEVIQSDVLLLYAPYNSVLRGALVEVGVALAHGKPVIVIGNSPSLSTWQFHPNVHWASNLRTARQLLRTLAI